MACSLTGRLYLDTFRLDIACTNRPRFAVSTGLTCTVTEVLSTAPFISTSGANMARRLPRGGYISQPGVSQAELLPYCLYHKPCKHLNCCSTSRRGVPLHIRAPAPRQHLTIPTARNVVPNRAARARSPPPPSATTSLRATWATVQDDGDQDIQRHRRLLITWLAISVKRSPILSLRFKFCCMLGSPSGGASPSINSGSSRGPSTGPTHRPTACHLRILGFIRI